MTLEIDEILIACFLSFFFLFIVIWSVLILKWRKKYFYVLFPCFKQRAKTKPIENKLEVKTISTNEDNQVVKEVGTNNQTSANEMKERLQFDRKHFGHNS